MTVSFSKLILKEKKHHISTITLVIKYSIVQHDENRAKIGFNFGEVATPTKNKLLKVSFLE